MGRSTGAVEIVGVGKGVGFLSLSPMMGCSAIKYEMKREEVDVKKRKGGWGNFGKKSRVGASRGVTHTVRSSSSSAQHTGEHRVTGVSTVSGTGVYTSAS